MTSGPPASLSRWSTTSSRNVKLGYIQSLSDEAVDPSSRAYALACSIPSAETHSGGHYGFSCSQPSND